MADIYSRMVRWAFARFYREFAWSYDTVAALVSWGYWRNWAQAVLPLVSGDVLELGCGTGNLQQELAGRSLFHTVVGLDLSPQMLAITSAKLARAQHPARLVRADAEALPFPAARFDTIVSTFPSEYIASLHTLGEVRRVLRPHGQVYVVLGAALGGPAAYRRLIALAYRLTLQQAPGDQPTIRAEWLLERMRAAGLDPSDAWIDAPGGKVYCIAARPLAEPR